MLGVASKSFVHVNLHAQNMHKSYMHNLPLSLFFHLHLLFFAIFPFTLTFLRHFLVHAARRRQNKTEQDYRVPVIFKVVFCRHGADCRHVSNRHYGRVMLAPLVDEHAKLKTNRGDVQNITCDTHNITRDAQNITFSMCV
jgi:hypothetical protein